MSSLRKQLPAYAQLMRIDKPIGIFLLLWPTLWALWLAAEGVPDWHLLVIFFIGTVLMRSAGCVINDYADRNIDGKVKRTLDRPLANGRVSKEEALLLFALLCVSAFIVVLFTNLYTVLLSIGGVLLAMCYPFMKRYTYFPQVVLGAAFAWSVPMAFMAQRESLPQAMWLVYLAVLVWTLVYDTFYAMVDREDDLKIGVKSTAILFGDDDRIITGVMQAIVVAILVLVGRQFSLGWIYYLSLVFVSGFFCYQQYLIRERTREGCFTAFLSNNWVGMIVFIGIAMDYAWGADIVAS